MKQNLNEGLFARQIKTLSQCGCPHFTGRQKEDRTLERNLMQLGIKISVNLNSCYSENPAQSDWFVVELCNNMG